MSRHGQRRGNTSQYHTDHIIVVILAVLLTAINVDWKNCHLCRFSVESTSLHILASNIKETNHLVLPSSNCNFYRMLSSRTDKLFTLLLNREIRKVGPEEVVILTNDRQLIRQIVHKLGRGDIGQLYRDMTDTKTEFYKRHLENGNG